MANDSRPDDVNIQVIRSVPTWSAVCALVSIVFACGGIYVTQVTQSAQIAEIKNIGLSINGKMNKMQIEQAEDRVRSQVLATEIVQIKIDVADVRKDVWKLQQTKSR